MLYGIFLLVLQAWHQKELTPINESKASHPYLNPHPKTSHMIKKNLGLGTTKIDTMPCLNSHCGLRELFTLNRMDHMATYTNFSLTKGGPDS
jgi:hypothetical protein